jgi:ABC-2 type transport system ATP-binding protein
MADPAIRTERLVKTYGRAKNRGLVGLDLQVDSGEVYGFLGPNGAGKSTTIRLLLDLIRPTGGHATVLGMDPRTAGPALRRRVGYLAGDFVVDGRQTGRELLTYLGNLRGGVPRSRIDGLAQRLDLDLSRRIKGLSKGNRQKLGVVQAFMRPPTGSASSARARWSPSSGWRTCANGRSAGSRSTSTRRCRRPSSPRCTASAT